MSNVKIPATGTGDATPTIATETIAGVEYQLVKLITGTAASTTPLTTFPVSAASLPLPTGAATSALQAGGLPAALGAGGGLKVDGSGTALPVTANAGTNLNTSALALDATVGTTNTNVGGLTETAPATDTASSGLNGRLQRIAQRLSSIIALLPTALGAGGGLKVDGSGTALPVTGTITAVTAITNALPTGTNTLGAVIGAGSATASTSGTQVASSATSVTLLSSNAARKGLLFMNNSTSLAYVLFGTTASTTAHTLQMAPNATYEMFGVNLYTGRIDAIWATANGNMQVTEW